MHSTMDEYAYMYLWICELITNHHQKHRTCKGKMCFSNTFKWFPCVLGLRAARRWLGKPRHRLCWRDGFSHPHHIKDTYIPAPEVDAKILVPYAKNTTLSKSVSQCYFKNDYCDHFSDNYVDESSTFQAPF